MHYLFGLFCIFAFDFVMKANDLLKQYAMLPQVGALADMEKVGEDGFPRGTYVLFCTHAVCFSHAKSQTFDNVVHSAGC